ncbi:2-deoxyglucose-6-phosphate phosphatase 2 [Wickerhamomyces ciferrii]|uniref:2-deoxyglucose-6-phosphate phosphatase 2 n=1 Tax=Wickerhamomyces ciferrii (strain ATCC 14091 / BCRC 22168 / CBS 111 / JCM 3599 / NBRC 0793 / NRRL Y-1031 F-60-10) TaxID=1206466 RepID=K0KKD6_WICCF|nr:2-deoxyglucose-6-phosphate phosphatase 2 [Wickerhamomyces ciferrii]CCH41583.1 2-deoxyglucose-6-phosphate phosphatase 2 [Wickerhamomyces ciferrii]
MTVSEPIVININAALFDVDGTIIDSSPSIAEFWREFGKDKPYFDAEHVIHVSHGWRTFDAIAKFAPDFAIPELVKELEGSVPDKFGQKAVEIPGSPNVVRQILALKTPDNKQKVAVATSGTYDMAVKWFKLMNLERPEVFITAESVSKGKPHPEPYLQGRERLGYKDADKKVVVFEDAPAGVKAGKDADCLVIGIASNFDAEKVKGFGADIVVPDLTKVEVKGYDAETDTFKLQINEYTHASEAALKLASQA